MSGCAGSPVAQRLQRQALPVEPPGLPVGQVDLQLQRRGCTAAGAGAAGAAGAARLEPGLDAAAQRGLRQPARQRRQIDLLQPGLQPGERLRLLRPQLGLGLERLAACEQLHLGLQPGQRTAQAQIELPVGRQRGVAAAAAVGARLGSGAELRLHRQRRGRADLEPAAQLQLIAAQPDRVEPVQAGGSAGPTAPAAAAPAGRPASAGRCGSRRCAATAAAPASAAAPSARCRWSGPAGRSSRSAAAPVAAPAPGRSASRALACARTGRRCAASGSGRAGSSACGCPGRRPADRAALRPAAPAPATAAGGCPPRS